MLRYASNYQSLHHRLKHVDLTLKSRKPLRDRQLLGCLVQAFLNLSDRAGLGDVAEFLDLAQRLPADARVGAQLISRDAKFRSCPSQGYSVHISHDT